MIHARLLELRPAPLIGLLGSLMATIVLPYRGPAAASRELARPVPRTTVRRRRRPVIRAEQGSTHLPDCRAYELVSPTYKGGYAAKRNRSARVTA